MYQELSKTEAFWKHYLTGFTAPTPLIVDRFPGRKDNQETDQGEAQIRLSDVVTSALKSLAQEHELTLNTFLQGAWALLLSRYRCPRV